MMRAGTVSLQTRLEDRQRAADAHLLACDDTALKEEGQHGEDQVFGWCSANGWKMTSARLEVLRILLIERRKQAGLTQAQLAEKLGSGWHQSTVASMENGQRKIDVLEFLKLSEAIGFDPAEFLKLVSSVRE